MRAHERSSFLVGRRELAEAVALKVPVEKALVTSAALRDGQTVRLLQNLAKRDVEVKEVDGRVLDDIAPRAAHQGVALMVGAYQYTSIHEIFERAATQPAALIVVLDHVTDEGNFGAIVRSAEILGAAGVIIADRRAASVGPGAYKASAGACLHLPIATVPNIASALPDLKSAGFWIAGASEHATTDAWSANLKGNIALVMGSEGSGLSQNVQKHCDFLVKLTQRGKIESLNVAQAATALGYEWLRQNRATLLPDAAGEQ